MRYIIIDPAARVALPEDHPSFDSALRSAGLDPKAVDHGTVGEGLGIVVYEYGLFKPTETSAYFTINGRLFEGPAVLYGYDKAGETVEARTSPSQPILFRTADEVEAEIVGGRVNRPTMSVNGRVLWQWPQRPPSGFPAPAYTAGQSAAG